MNKLLFILFLFFFSRYACIAQSTGNNSIEPRYASDSVFTKDRNILFVTKNQNVQGFYQKSGRWAAYNLKHVFTTNKQMLYYLSPDGLFFIYSEKIGDTLLFYQCSIQESTILPPKVIDFNDLPEQNIALTLVRGKVLTDDGSIPAKTQIRLYAIGSSEELKYVYNPNPTNGTYLIILPPGQDYTMIVESEGFETYSKVIQVPSQSYYYQLQHTVYLNKDNSLSKTIGIEDRFVPTPTNKRDSASKEDLLVQFIEKVITNSDTHTLKHLDQYLQNDLHGETKYFSSLSQVIEKVIANSDLIMLQNLEKITRSMEPKEPDLVLYFSSNNAELTKEHVALLNAYFIAVPNNAKLDISGHSDFIGSSLSKYLISSLRTKSVSDYIDFHYPNFSDQYTVNIKSDSEPLEGQSLEKNRRVEIRVVK